jgi:hypothetical protein
VWRTGSHEEGAAVFLGPARSPGPFFARFCEALRLPRGVALAMLRRIAARVGAAIEDLDVGARLCLANTRPTGGFAARYTLCTTRGGASG